jgi:hypothetical protein
MPSVAHEEVSLAVGQRLKLTVSRDACVLFLSDADYETYVGLEPLPGTLYYVARPPLFEAVCCGVAHWHVLVWPISDREPEWKEDFSYGINVEP